MTDQDPGMGPSDQSLLRRLKAGEEDAATALYLRYADHLRHLARSQSSPALAARLDPDDIVQSVVRTFFRRAAIDGYDVPDGDDLWRLLLVIALRKIRNAAAHHKAARRDVRQTISVDAAGAGAARSGSEADLAVLRMVIDEALSGLPEDARRIVALRIEGHEIAEIASRVDRSLRSVERVLQGFRQMLGRRLDDDDR